MTKLQAELLKFIEAFIEKNGYCPSFEEMMAATGQKSKSSIFRLLTGLEVMGRIRRLPNKKRAIEVVKNPSMALASLSHIPLEELAREAKRRHLVLCHAYRDAYGERSFVEIPIS